MTPSTRDTSLSIILNDDDMENDLHVVHNTISEKSSNFELTSNPFGSSVTINIEVQGNYPTLELDIQCDTDTNQVILSQCISGTLAYCIPKCKSTLRNSIIVTLNGNTIKCMVIITSFIANDQHLGDTWRYLASFSQKSTSTFERAQMSLKYISIS